MLDTVGRIITIWLTFGISTPSLKTSTVTMYAKVPSSKSATARSRSSTEFLPLIKRAAIPRVAKALTRASPSSIRLTKIRP